MRHQDALEGQALLPQLPFHPVELQPGIDDEGRGRVAPANQVAVFAEELIREDRDVQLLPEGLRGCHPTPTSCEAGVSTWGPASVTSTISSSRTPPHPGR